MKKSKKCDDVVKQIANAFADTPHPKDDKFGYDWWESENDNMETHFSKHKHWSDIPFELLFRYRDDGAFLTIEGLRYILPALMTLILVDGHKADTGIDSIIYYLTPPKLLKPLSYTRYEQKKFRRLVNVLTVEERKAIFAFLECYGEVFQVDLEAYHGSTYKDRYESALIYWYLLINGDLPKPNHINS